LASIASIDTSRISEVSSGKIPTTSVRRPISLQRVCQAQLAPVLGRERVERHDVLLGLLEHGRDLR
jgi:hypothetical protein